MRRLRHQLHSPLGSADGTGPGAFSEEAQILGHACWGPLASYLPVLIIGSVFLCLDRK